ncbi:MAG TPA: hypothetical protein VFS39_01890 [Nitrospira sp.]|nr:hypothetical protein [Nitrospira sp.]
MSKILYLLRRPVDRVPDAISAGTEADGEIILLEQSVGSAGLFAGRDQVWTLGASSVAGNLSYEELVDKIFEADRVIVL